MHCSFVVALALVATVSSRSATIHPSNEENTTVGDFAEEYTTVDTNANLKVIGNHDARNNTTRDVIIFRKRRLGGTGVVQADPRQFNDGFPYVVALYDADDNYVCVGTILTPNLILSAAHCFEGDPVSYIRANSRDSYKGGQKHSAGDTIFYGKGHDIALLRLKTKISNAVTVSLLESNILVPVGDPVVAVGWGKVENDKWPRYLMQNDLIVSKVKECWDLYESENWICTETKTSYSCDGDSGGPLLYYDEQVGIISGSLAEKCGSGLPTRNVNLKKYLHWIKSYAPDDVIYTDEDYKNYDILQAS